MKFKDEVKRFIEDCLKRKPSLEPHFADWKLICDSGNPWKPDIVIVDSGNSQVKFIGEIKMENYGYENPIKPRKHTHTEHMWRAGARFCDVKSRRVPKYLLFPYLVERRFNFNEYFRHINVTLLNWEKIEDREMLRRTIKQL
jgi:hypothetical protein